MQKSNQWFSTHWETHRKHSSKKIATNKLRVQVSINVVRWLAFEAWAIRYHNESINSSLNRNNFLELMQLLSCYNEKVVDIVIKKASTNASYTSSHISKRRLFSPF